MSYSYEILPRPLELGGGWRLRLLENDVEVGGGVFPASENFEHPDDALKIAYFDAEDEAYAWLASRAEHDCGPQPDERCRRQAAIDAALANVGISGLTPSAEVRNQMGRFIDGEIGFDEFIKSVIDHVQRTLDGHQ